jgi:hypothetical protein
MGWAGPLEAVKELACNVVGEIEVDNQRLFQRFTALELGLQLAKPFGLGGGVSILVAVYCG